MVHAINICCSRPHGDRKDLKMVNAITHWLGLPQQMLIADHFLVFSITMMSTVADGDTMDHFSHLQQSLTVFIWRACGLFMGHHGNTYGAMLLLM